MKQLVAKAILVLKHVEMFPEPVGKRIEILADTALGWYTHGIRRRFGSSSNIMIGTAAVAQALEDRNQYPIDLRYILDDQVEFFLASVERTLHDFLTSIQTDYYDPDYDGLDSNRDTEEQVEFAVSLFPRVLSRKAVAYTGHCEEAAYPIEFLLFSAERRRDALHDLVYNLKAISFIPLLAKLGIELGQFERRERGGLLDRDCITSNKCDSVLNALVTPYATNETVFLDAVVDEHTLGVLNKLREIGLLTKEDIYERCLLHMVCDCEIFSERKFRFLVDWDPEVLLDFDDSGKLPLDYLLDMKRSDWDCILLGKQNGDDRVEKHFALFRAIFGVVVKSFPDRNGLGIGLVFREPQLGSLHRSLFRMARRCCGSKQATKLMEDALVGHAYRTEDVLLDQENLGLGLDGLYFLLRRDPSVMDLHKRRRRFVAPKHPRARDCPVAATTRTNHLGKRKRGGDPGEPSAGVDADANCWASGWHSTTNKILRSIFGGVFGGVVRSGGLFRNCMREGSQV